MGKIAVAEVASVQRWGDGDIFVCTTLHPDGPSIWFPRGTRIAQGELIVYVETDEPVSGTLGTFNYYRLITQEEYDSGT